VTRPVRVLVTGGAGTVAGWFVRAAPDGHRVEVTERSTPVPDDVRARAGVHRVDLTGPGDVLRLVARLRPDAVVHTAYSTPGRADIVDATAAVAAACAATGASLVHLSTDVVFGGDHPPYREDDPPSPVSDYGRWKADAEQVAMAAVPDVCITRTSIVVAVDPPDPATAAFMDRVRGGTVVRLFHDEWRQPIRARDLAAELWALLALDRAAQSGVWHLPGPERLSRLDLGLRLARAAGLHDGAVGAAVESVSAAGHPTPRPRDPALVGERRRSLGHPPRPVPG
jgi:dTDP-4-dehydrorhamnose reductase